MAGVLSLSLSAHSAQVTLNCTPPTLNDDGSLLVDLSSIEIHYGMSPGNYSNVEDMGLDCVHIVTLPDDGNTYYFAATATNSDSLRSDFSNEVFYTTVPQLPGTIENLQIIWAEQTAIFSLPETDIPPYLAVGNFNLNPAGAVIDFEITPRSFPSSDTRIISKATSTAEQAHIFMVSMYNGALRFRLKTNGVTTTLFGSAQIPLNQKTTGRVEYDGAQMRIYVNDVLDASTAKTGLIDQTADPVWVGANPPDGYGAFDGLISVTVN